MCKDKQRSPWWAIPLIALASFRYDYHWESGAHFHYHGMNLAIPVICIIAIVMIAGIKKRVQSVLRTHKLIEHIPQSRLWMLLPFAIFMPACSYRSVSGPIITDTTGEHFFHQVDFNWGGGDKHIWFILGTLLIIFLHTTMLTLREIERSPSK